MGSARGRAGQWIGILAVLGAVVALAGPSRLVHAGVRAFEALNPKRTISDRLAEHAADVRARCEPACAAVGVAWPPARVALVAFKRERRLDLYAAEREGPWRRVRSYPILAASGDLGPKLVEGDRQVPEGVYAVAALNPASRFHLALRVAYPDADDLARARADGRTNLGGDIMVHGGASSVGCLAMGDPAIEELFVVVALAGLDHASIVIAPCEPRGFAAGRAEAFDAVPPSGAPAWTPVRWETILTALAAFAGR